MQIAFLVNSALASNSKVLLMQAGLILQYFVQKEQQIIEGSRTRIRRKILRNGCAHNGIFYEKVVSWKMFHCASTEKANDHLQPQVKHTFQGYSTV